MEELEDLFKEDPKLADQAQWTLLSYPHEMLVRLHPETISEDYLGLEPKKRLNPNMTPFMVAGNWLVIIEWYARPGAHFYKTTKDQRLWVIQKIRTCMKENHERDPTNRLFFPRKVKRYSRVR